MSAPPIADFPRLPIPGWLLTLAALTTIPSFWAGAAEYRPTDTNSAVEKAPLTSVDPAETKEKRVREGTKIDKTGYFRTTGDRVTFYVDDGKTRYRGLENLMLERIARTIEDSPGQLDWTVTGIVTEYRGANFLLVMHAVLKTDGTRSPQGQTTRLGGRQQPRFLHE